MSTLIIKIDEEIHTKLKVKASQEQTTMQDLIEPLIKGLVNEKTKIQKSK